MDCKNCNNNMSKDKDGYVFCPLSLLGKCQVDYDDDKEKFICNSGSK